MELVDFSRSYTGKLYTYYEAPDGVRSVDVGEEDFFETYCFYRTSSCLVFDKPPMLGYKAFDEHWTCRGKKYEVGKTFEEDIKFPNPCNKGMHFCLSLLNIFYYYDFDLANTKVALVKAHGLVVTTDNEKYCTNKIEIVEQIPPEAIAEMVREIMFEKLRNDLPPDVLRCSLDKLRRADEAEILAKPFRPFDMRKSRGRECGMCKHAEVDPNEAPCKYCYRKSCWEKRTTEQMTCPIFDRSILD